MSIGQHCYDVLKGKLECTLKMQVHFYLKPTEERNSYCSKICQHIYTQNEGETFIRRMHSFCLIRCI